MRTRTKISKLSPARTVSPSAFIAAVTGSVREGSGVGKLKPSHRVTPAQPRQARALLQQQSSGTVRPQGHRSLIEGSFSQATSGVKRRTRGERMGKEKRFGCSLSLGPFHTREVLSAPSGASSMFKAYFEQKNNGRVIYFVIQSEPIS